MDAPEGVRTAPAATTVAAESMVQKYLGRKGMVAYLGALTIFPFLSTDLYLPALPGMTSYFGVAEYLTNLTLISFFVVLALAALVWGPLSDRYGRRPGLLVGLTMYAVAGALCAVSSDVYQLIGFRILQALGAASAGGTATAIVKDMYHGRRREVIIAAIQSIIVLSPAIAPMIGALILRFTSWRGTFAAQAIFGLLALLGTVAFQETIAERLTGHPLRSLKRLGVVLRNRTFDYYLINFSLLGIPAMAFVASSSYIYEETFGVSSQVFSYFFAVYAVSLAVGSQIYVRVSLWAARDPIIWGCLAISTVSGALLLFLGHLGPWIFMICLVPSQMAFMCMRPPAVYLMLAQHDQDSGSVAAVMGSTHTVLASAGMVIVSLSLWGRVEMVGLLMLVLGVASLAMWMFRPRRAKVS